MNKSETIRNERDNKDKLLDDFKHIIYNDVNMEFQQLFLNRFVDSWINKKNDSYELNLYWSKQAIEQKIHIERNKQRERVELKQARKQSKGNEFKAKDIKKNINKHYKAHNSQYKYNHDHLVPKVVFEDIFVHVNRVGIWKSNPNKFEKRLEQNYVYFIELMEQQYEHLEYENYLKIFFDEYFTVVTLTKKEHDNLSYPNAMPDEFFEHGNKWCRYKYTKTEEEIEVYEVDFGNLKGIMDWEQVTCQSLLQLGCIKKKIDYDGYIPFS